MEEKAKKIEQEFMKKAVTLAKDKNLSSDNINELLIELKVGEKLK